MLSQTALGVVVGFALVGFQNGCASREPQAGINPVAADESEGAEPELESLQSRASYGLGLKAGQTCVEQAIEIDPEAFILGLRDGLAESAGRLSEEQIDAALLEFQQRLAVKQAALIESLGEQFRKSGQEFLRTNASKPGVVRLPSGLQYEIIEEGTGPIPEADDSVLVHYLGTLTNGIPIDESNEQEGPALVPVDLVIPGWSEALQLMKVGSKWRLYIPPELAYGDTSPPNSAIPPNAVLIYELELLGIVDD